MGVGMETDLSEFLSQGVSGTSSLCDESVVRYRGKGGWKRGFQPECRRRSDRSVLQTATYNGKNVAIGQKNFQYTTGDPIGTISGYRPVDD